MKLLVSSFGSLGDVEPYLAVALALQARGHEVCVATLDRFAARTRALGLRFASLGVDWDATRFDAMMREVLAKRSPLAQAGTLYTLTADAQRRATHALVPLLAQHDLLFTHVFHLAGYAAARLTAKPWVTGHLVSGMIPGDGPSPIGRDFGSVGNTLRRRIVDVGVARATDAPIGALLTSLGLPPLRHALRGGVHSPILNLVAVSETVRPRDASWGDRYQLTGAWRVHDAALPAAAAAQDSSLGAALDAFLRAGPPPLFVTLGSTVGFDSADIARRLFAALGDTRAIVQSGWAGLTSPSPAHFVFDGHVSYQALLPRVRGVIHHGGAGTTAACLHAGRPMITLHSLGDQFAWGALCERLGVSSGNRHLRAFSPRWLRAAVARLPADAAAALALRLNQEEDGAVRAARLIEAVARPVNHA